MAQIYNQKQYINSGLGEVSELLILDNFDGVAGLLSTHTPDIDTVGGGWSFAKGSLWYINGSGQTYASPSILSIFVIDSGVSDCVITDNITLTSGATLGNRGTAFRYTDVNNMWKVEILSGLYRILELNGGTQISRASKAVTTTPGQVYEIEVTANGNSITATLNGGDAISYNSATFNNSATIHGIISRINDDFHNTFTVVSL